jgi:hypothetical protein
MDFIEGIPKASGFSCILVLVDRFSKYAHFILLAHPFTQATMATAFMNNVYKLHGGLLPLSLTVTRFFLASFGRNCFG